MSIKSAHPGMKTKDLPRGTYRDREGVIRTSGGSPVKTVLGSTLRDHCGTVVAKRK